MSTFEAAIPTILAHEGGFVNNANDPGGATNFGVSLRWLRGQDIAIADIDHDGDVDADDIKALTSSIAAKFYQTMFWDKFGYGQVSDQNVATKLFDLAVNTGPVQAAKLIQRAASACGQQIDVDGKLGAHSYAAINAADPASLMFHLRDQSAAFYRNLVAKKPTLSTFLAGWLRRAYS
jgi:lysozyme family protein